VHRNALTMGVAAKALYEQLNRRAEYMQNVRRTFYCMLCSTKLRENILTKKREILLKLFHQRIFYADSFCRQLFSQTFNQNLQMKEGFNRFTAAVLKMLTCVKNGQASTDTNSP
jgi:hypothetical protein